MAQPPKMRTGTFTGGINPKAKTLNPGNRMPEIGPDAEEAQPNRLGEELRARLEAAQPKAAPAQPAPQSRALPQGGVRVAPKPARPADQVRTAQANPPRQAEAAPAPVYHPEVRNVKAETTYKDLASEGFTRVGLPSHCRPYANKDIFVRPLFCGELAALSAATSNNSFTMMIDALSPAINVDIRTLTGSDFQFLMYWWRLNSFLNSPYTFRWRSRYGNQNSKVLTKSNQTIVELAMTQDEVDEYANKGIRFSTIRDEEALRDMKDVPEADRFLMARAQYVALSPEEDAEALATGQWFTKRIEKLKKSNIAFLEDVRDFKEKSVHGVKETFDAETDDKFDPAKAVIFLRDMAADFAERVDTADASETVETVEAWMEKARDYAEEANEIEAKLEENVRLQEMGEPMLSILPRKEVIALSVNVLDFFPKV